MEDLTLEQLFQQANEIAARTDSIQDRLTIKPQCTAGNIDTMDVIAEAMLDLEEAGDTLALLTVLEAATAAVRRLTV